MLARFRPRFTQPVNLAPSAVLAALRAAVQRPDTPVTGIILSDAVELRVPEAAQNFFTPVLHVVVDGNDAGTVLRARFAPHPHVWMLVMSLYFTLALIGVAGVVFALTQVVLGGPLWSLLAVPATLALGGFLHGAVLIGQGLSAEAMHTLRSFLERVLERAAEDHAGQHGALG